MFTKWKAVVSVILALLASSKMRNLALAAGAAVVAGDGRPAVTEPRTTAGDSPAEKTGAGDVAGGELVVGPVYPIPLDSLVRRFVAVAGQDGTRRLGEAGVAGGSDAGAAPGAIAEVEGSVADSEGGILVYENTLSTAFQGPPSQFPLAEIADDIATTAAYGCNLDRYVVRVAGDLNRDGVVAGGLTVFTALYPACPRGGGVVPIRGTSCVFGIAAVESTGVLDLTCRIPELASVPIPTNLYLGVGFNRSDAGVAVGAPAFSGFSLDSFDHPAFPCGAGLGVGGFGQGGLHASFYTQLYVREPCGSSFIGYKSTRQSQGGFSPGGNVRFADDIHLGTDSCDMIAYEVSFKGTVTGTVIMDLRTALSNVDAENGNVIPGTRVITSVAPANQVFLARVNLPTPIDPPRDFYVSFRTSSASLGPILSGVQGGPGTTADVHYVYRSGAWQPTYLTAWDAFDVAIICDGSPPVGACCDMFLTENRRCMGGTRDGESCLLHWDCVEDGYCNGESVCRQVPEMNCTTSFAGPDFQPQWVEGATCDSSPFPHPCGVGKCCTPDDTCANLTVTECAALSVSGDPVWWFRGHYCEAPEAICPLYACTRREGNCNVAHPEPGCRDPFCCDSVCQMDPYCCRVEWDRNCVEASLAMEDCYGAHNDRCDPDSGTPDVPSNGSMFLSNASATSDDADPRFCCVSDTPEAQGFGSVWFKFVATHESASVRTCHSDAAGDSMVQVFAVGDPTDHTTACSSLTSIGCSDDEEECGDSGRHARVCVDGLIPGATYYLMVASKTAEAQGLHQLDIVSPCQFEVPFATADCNASGTQDGCDLQTGASPDCNGNTLPDECDISAATSADCNANAVPDECDVAAGTSPDCQKNAVPDECDVARGDSPDCNTNARPDECDISTGDSVDCQANGVPDECDIVSATSFDCNADEWPDECTPEPLRLLPLPESRGYESAVALCGDLAVVGAPGDFGSNDAPMGRVHVFRRLGPRSWELEQVLVAPDGIEDDGFGASVACADGWIFVAAPGHNHAQDRSGSVYAFERIDTTWTAVNELYAPDTGANLDFGVSLATDGGRLVVGGVVPPADPPIIIGCGIPNVETPFGFIFTNVNGAWIPTATLEIDLLTWGVAVAIAGDWAVLGLGNARVGDTYRAGVVGVFQHTNEGWIEQVRLYAPESDPYPSFGSSVSMHKNRLLVGATGADGSCSTPLGAGFVFERSGDLWALEAVLRAPSDLDTSWFGFRGSIRETSAVLAAVWTEPDGPVAFLFQKGSDGSWSEAQPFADPIANGQRRLTNSVALDGDVALVHTGDWYPQGAGSMAHIYAVPDQDCNANSIPDRCDVRDNTSPDCNANEIPDECEPARPGDGDLDGDTDLDDFAQMTGCLNGPNGQLVTTCCEPFDDAEADGDVDLRDAAAFLNVFEGE